VPPAVLPVYSGFEASGRRGRFVRPAGWIAERARDASTSATIVPHRPIRMLLAHPTLVPTELAIRFSHRPILSG